MKYDLSGQVYLVTGAGSGIGAATARRLAQAGAAVMLAGRNKGKLLEVQSTLPVGCRSELFSADVSNESEVATMIAQIEARHGGLNGAFNNAGIFGNFGPLHLDQKDNFDQVMNVNVKGIWSCMKHQIPALIRQGGGAIVNCSSVAGHQGHGRSPVYSASKHAIIGLSKSTALQYSRHGIRINVLSPGSTDTPILRSLYDNQQTFDERAQRAPLGRVGRPEEIAESAIWLLSPLSSYVNGHTLIADGGVLAGAASPISQTHIEQVFS